MEEKKSKKFDAIYSNSLIHLIERLNKENIKREDIVEILNGKEGYVVILYM